MTRPVRPGLTLLEVLLSLVILLISLAALGQLVDFGEDRAQAAALASTGTRLAQSKLAEAEAGALDVTTSANGTFDEEPDWTWTLESAAGPAANLYTVTVRVGRDYKGRRVETVLSQMICDPNQMGGAAAAQPPTTTTTTASGSGS
jgi:prepilin-type N-terminal cleavage/methylation domain-containing protein